MKTLKLRKYLLLLVVFLSVLCCSSCKAKPQTFSKLEMKIELTDEFYEKSHVSYTAYYESSEIICLALRESFSLLPGSESWSTQSYATRCIKANNLLNTSEHLSTSGKTNYCYFEFMKTVNGETFSYYAACYKAEEAFWLIQFGGYTSNYADIRDDIVSFAESVVFE